MDERSSTPNIRGAAVTYAIVVRTTLQGADELARLVESQANVRVIYEKVAPGRLRIVAEVDRS